MVGRYTASQALRERDAIANLKKVTDGKAHQ